MSIAQKIDLGGFQMNVEIHKGTLPMDTVFLHGNLASNRWWHPAVEVWKKNSHPGMQGSLILAEWRGCGKSAAPESESELEPEILAEDYIALLKKLGIKKSCLVGHSTGGLISLIAMIKAPELFERAFLLDPVSASGVQFEQPMYDAFTEMSKSRDFCAMVMGGTIHNNKADSDFFRGIVDDTFGVAKAIWHGVPKALHKVNITSDLKKIHHPVLVAHGEFDTLLPIEKSREMANLLPNGSFLELKGHGHSTNVENPEFFVKTVNDFLFNRN